jgi:FAD-dependent urate hydroxylase
MNPFGVERVETKVLIIGAGPYGVALGLELHRLNVPAVVVGQPFELWRHHTSDRSRLRSDLHSSTVFSVDGRFDLRRYLEQTFGGERAEQLAAERLPIPLFREYLGWVEQQLPFFIRREAIVDVRREGALYVATSGAGTTLTASSVVVATGLGGFAHLPTALRMLPGARVLHGFDQAGVKALSGQRVMVVGSGQTAGEAISLLRASGNEVTWVTRTPPVFFTDPIHLPRAFWDAAMKGSQLFVRLPTWLRARLTAFFAETTMTPELEAVVRAKDVRHVASPVAALQLSVRSHGVHSQALQQDFDVVVACTGYRPSVERLGFLSEALRGEVEHVRGLPRLDRHFESTAPGLFIVGCLAELAHGPAQRFLAGARHASVTVAQRLSRPALEVGSPAPGPRLTARPQ